MKKIKQFFRELKIVWGNLKKQPYFKLGPIVIDDMEYLGVKNDGKWHDFTITFKVQKTKDFDSVAEIKIYDKIIKK